MSGARWTSKGIAALGKAALPKRKRSAPKHDSPNLFQQACPKFGLPTPVCEYRFHPVRKWRIDYYFEANGRRVGLEVEGGIWSGGRHTRGAGFKGDMEKYNAAAQMGITILRVVPADLLKIQNFDLIKKTLYGG